MTTSPLPSNPGGAISGAMAWRERARAADARGRHDAAVDALEGAARQGDAAAMTELGSRLLIGDRAPFDLAAGLARLTQAAGLGEPEALTLTATLVAAGVAAPPSWAEGLDRLETAAVLGGNSARAQLRLLAGGPSGPPPPAPGDEADGWRALRRRVDVEAWMAPPPREVLCEAPRVRLGRGFASAATCGWLVAKAAGRLRAAMMYDGETKTEAVDPHRSCSDYQFDILRTDLVVLLVRARAEALTKLSTVFMEPPRIFHYALGQDIKPHYDRIGNAVEGYGPEGGYLGDRIVTLLVYLNDGYDGGELDFPKAGFRCKGARGDAVYFAHVDGAGRQDPLSLHAGLVITRGEKWVLSQWIHDRPFGVVTPPEARPAPA